MEAAKQMIERLQSSRCGRIVSSMEKLSDAYIQLAYWDVSQYKKETSKWQFWKVQLFDQLHWSSSAAAWWCWPYKGSRRFGRVTLKRGQRCNKSYFMNKTQLLIQIRAIITWKFLAMLLWIFQPYYQAAIYPLFECPRLLFGQSRNQMPVPDRAR